MRLDKFLAETGKGTRTQVKQIIKQGRVKINSQIIKKPEHHINENSDTIEIDNIKIEYTRFEYYMLNKPAGVVSAVKDKTDKTVIDLIDCSKKDLFPVGRLDKDTEGLLLITNDGELAHKLLAPGKHVDKKYYAHIKGRVTQDTIILFEKGLDIGEGMITMPAKLNIIKSDDVSQVEIIIQEGKFHQIKRMFKAVGMEVLYLKRISMKNLILDECLELGGYRKLTQTELEGLK